MASIFIVEAIYEDSSFPVSSWSTKEQAEVAAQNYADKTPVTLGLETVEITEIPFDEPAAATGDAVKMYFTAVYDVAKNGKNIDKNGTGIEIVDRQWRKYTGSEDYMVSVNGSVITVQNCSDDYFARKDILKAIKAHFSKDDA